MTARTRWTATLAAVAALGLGAVLSFTSDESSAGEGAEAAAADAPLVRVHKLPTCGCCTAWVEHLREAGFRVEVKDADDLRAVKREAGVPLDLQACHTAFVEGYVVEGHVPAEDVRRLLEERPEVRGVAVPGMPVGSPGMEGPDPQPYDVIAFGDDGTREVFASH